MCQMVVTGERYVFYFGIFICGGTLNFRSRIYKKNFLAVGVIIYIRCTLYRTLRAYV